MKIPVSHSHPYPEAGAGAAHRSQLQVRLDVAGETGENQQKIWILAMTHADLSRLSQTRKGFDQENTKNHEDSLGWKWIQTSQFG